MEAMQNPDPNSPMVYTRAPDGSITAVEQDAADRARSREEGWQMWKDVMGLRFLRGDDLEFDYQSVDDNEEFDDWEEDERRKLEEYLEGEKAEFIGDGPPSGETGIQDF